MKLRMMARIIVFFHTGIDASSAADTSGKLQAISPERIGHGLLGADLKFPSIFLEVSLFQLYNGLFLFFFGHFVEMLL
jgi:membrane associated rhomboid family serine protease